MVCQTVVVITRAPRSEALMKLFQKCWRTSDVACGLFELNETPTNPRAPLTPRHATNVPKSPSEFPRHGA
jgi:hypothetical protein